MRTTKRLMWFWMAMLSLALAGGGCILAVPPPKERPPAEDPDARGDEPHPDDPHAQPHDPDAHPADPDAHPADPDAHPADPDAHPAEPARDPGTQVRAAAPAVGTLIPLPEQPKVIEELPEPPAKVKIPRYTGDALVGKPDGMDEAVGKQAAYWIWRPKNQAVFYLRTTAIAKHKSTFHGRVRGLADSFKEVKGTRTEFGDQMKINKNGVSFKFVTWAGVDGFDFHSKTPVCARFILKTDDDSPKRIYVGKNRMEPSKRRFDLCP